MEKDNSRRIRIDIVKLAKYILDDKRKMMIYCATGAVISIIVAFSIPRIYKSKVMLAPEETSNGFSGNISSLASMVGMNMKFGTSGDAIYPEIYPDALESTEFLVSLFPIKVTSKDQEIKDMPYSEYMARHQHYAWWEWPKNAMTAVMEKIKGDDGSSLNEKPDPTFLTKKQFDLTKAISRNINCQVDKKTNVIDIEVTDQDPLIAKTMVNAVTAQLQTFITNYRTNKARNDEAYMEKLFREAEEQYTKARLRYAAFCEANTKVALKSVESKMEELENEMQLKHNIYTQVVEQLQMAKAKVQERTPAFTTLQNATVPVKHSNAPKILILIAFVFQAFLLRVCILVKRNYKEILIFP
ncbi:MAG: chain-length determining protein [Prevotella sp.]|nr:chain-length determining protein [Prevotella sp.]